MSILPRDWAALGARLDKWKPQEGPFEPAGAWNVEYTRHALMPSPDGTPGGGRSGSLSVRHLAGEGERALKVVETIGSGSGEMVTEADIRCGAAPLLTPRHWNLRIRCKTRVPVVNGELDQDCSGRVDGREIVLVGRKERRIPAPVRWTSFWSLFAAIPALPFDARGALQFDMCDELDALKPDHRLEYVGEHAVTAGGWSRKLHVFEQTGRGMLPWRWWLDASHMVLLSAGGRRAYLLDRITNGDAS